MARILLPALNRFKLDTVAKALNISLENHHRAVDDAACTAEIFVKFIQDAAKIRMHLILIRSTRWESPDEECHPKACLLTM